MVMELALQTMTSYRATLELAQWSDERGLSCLAVADHYLGSAELDSPALDQLVVLGGIARETTRIELATLVSPLTFRHPGVMLKTAVTLDEMSGGRFTLGVGTGWMREEHEAFGFDFPAERFDRLEEVLAYLRAGISRSASGFEGKYYRLAPFDPQPQPDNLRLVVGGSGARRTPELAGKYADEFNVFPDKVPVSDRVAGARTAATTAGRDPDALKISYAFPTVVGEDGTEVDALLATTAADRKVTPERLRQRWGELGIPFGTVDQVAAALAGLSAVGVTRVYLQVASDELAPITRMVELLVTTGHFAQPPM